LERCASKQQTFLVDAYDLAISRENEFAQMTDAEAMAAQQAYASAFQNKR
jgi:hypothetical protein